MTVFPRPAVRSCSVALLSRLEPIARRVTDVFRGSFLSRGDDATLHFTADETALHPASVLLGRATVAGTCEGDAVIVAWPELRVGERRLEIERILADPARPGFIDRAVLESNLRKLDFLLAQTPRASAVTRALRGGDSPFRAAIREVRADLGRGNLDLAAFLDCFGGGEGLTPAWDDFAAGLLLSDRVNAAGLVRADADLLARAARRTTAVAAQQLAFAAEGRSSLRFESIACRLPAERIRAAEFARAIGTGHTSGADILSGLALHGHARLDPMKEIAA